MPEHALDWGLMTVIGTLGGMRRDEVTPWGAVMPGDGSPMLDWWVAAEDQWHRPATEPTIRQRHIDGTPVVETRVRVPGGDVVHRVGAVPDHGGLILIEVTNESPLPVAIALTRPDLWLVRPPTEVPSPGADLPTGSVILPLGHRATLRAALRHHDQPLGALPGDLPALEAVARGWTSLCEGAGRVVIPERPMVHSWVSARCQAALDFDDDLRGDPLTWLLRCAEAVRLGEPADRWLPEAAGALERVLRGGRRFGGKRQVSGPVAWDVWRAVLGVERLAHLCGDHRAMNDLGDLVARLGGVGSVPTQAPTGVRDAVWLEDRLARPTPDGGIELFPGGLQPTWFGASIEAHDLQMGVGRRLSFALRWHGERPALLWELSGDDPRGRPTALRGGGVDPTWSSDQAQGEALLSVPPGAPATSFS